MGRLLIVLGLVLAAAGLLINLGFPIGRLPGDFSVRRGNFSFYFPLATSTWPRTQETIARCFQDVSAQAREKVLWQNAATLYPL